MTVSIFWRIWVNISRIKYQYVIMTISRTANNINIYVTLYVLSNYNWKLGLGIRQFCFPVTLQYHIYCIFCFKIFNYRWLRRSASGCYILRLSDITRHCCSKHFQFIYSCQTWETSLRGYENHNTNLPCTWTYKCVKLWFSWARSWSTKCITDVITGIKPNIYI